LATPKVQITSLGIPAAVVRKTKFFPPDMAVRIAWGLTNQLSENESVRLEATRATKLMNDIRIKAQESKDEMEEQYVNWVCECFNFTSQIDSDS